MAGGKRSSQILAYQLALCAVTQRNERFLSRAEKAGTDVTWPHSRRGRRVSGNEGLDRETGNETAPCEIQRPEGETAMEEVFRRLLRAGSPGWVGVTGKFF